MKSQLINKVFSAILIVILAFTTLPITSAQAATAGPNNAGTGSNINGPGTIAWTNPGNITTAGSPYATSALTGGATSEYLQATNYGFSIPAGATITGITVNINRQSSSSAGGNSVDDSVVRLIKGGTIVGSNFASTTDWPTSLGTATYGSTTNMWGTTWTPAEINASNFGVALSVLNESGSSRTATVNTIQVTVTYFLNATTVGVATATATSASAINVSMPYTEDGNANNNYTVEYKLSSSGTWSNWVTNAAHVASPYATNITGLSPLTSYDVRVTYNDADGVTGTNPQVINNIVTEACGTSLNYTAPAGTNRVVVVFVSTEGGTSPSNVQIGGTAATSIANINQGDARIFAGYRVIGTSAVAQAMNVTATNGECFYATTYENINQTIGNGASNTINSIATGTSASGTTTTSNNIFNATGGAVNNVANGRVVYGINMNQGSANNQVNLGTSSAWAFAELFDGYAPGDGNRTGIGHSTTLTAGSATISVAASTGHNRAALIAFALNPAASSPTVTTQAVTGINPIDVTGNGTITSLGTSNPTAYGFVWNTSGTPTLADSFSDLGATNTTGAFNGAITGLSPNTTYFVRAYATNSVGTAYGNEVSFTTTASPVFTSVDNTSFDIGAIGNFNITATGNPSTMTISLTGALPTGVSFTDNGNGTASFDGTPAVGTEGTYNLILTADNGIAPNGIQNFTFYVRNGPGVSTVNSSPDTGDGYISENESISTALGITQITVEFSRDVYDDPTDTTNFGDDVTNPANYLLVRSTTGTFATTSCSGGATAPDVTISVDSVTYSNSGGSGPFIATLEINSGLPLNIEGFYRLFVCGTTSIVDAANPLLVLAGDGITPGTDFIRSFRISAPVAGGGGGGGGASSSTTTTTPTLTGLLIPVTGFVPSQVTQLPTQPVDKEYTESKLTLKIPSLGVNLPIVGIGLDENGWDVTWLGNNAGYLEGSAYPTWKGNTILTSHVTDPNGKNGPFAYINELREGEKVYIHNDGFIYVYEVRHSQRILPTSIKTLFKSEEDAWLTLVTCENFNEKANKFTHRRIVRAVLISVIPEK